MTPLGGTHVVNQVDGDFGTVKVKDNLGEVHTFSVHIPTGTVNNNDSCGVIRTKFALLAVAGTAYAIAMRLLRALSHLFFLQWLCYKVTGLKRFEISNDQAWKQFKQAIPDLFYRIILYGIALQIVAVIGVVAPKAMRLKYATLEYELNQGAKLSEGYYKAPCFQELAKLHTILTSKRLKKHIQMQRTNKDLVYRCVFKWTGMAIDCGRSLNASSPIPQRLVSIPSRNIASPAVAKKAFYHIRHPRARAHYPMRYKDIGKEVGLRVGKNVRLEPVKGHCVGMALRILSKSSARATARQLQNGADGKSAKLQAIYRALLNEETTVPEKDLKLITDMIVEGRDVDNSEFQYPKVAEAIKAFLSSPQEAELKSYALRKSVLEYLEKDSVEITPEIYALVQKANIRWVSSEIIRAGGTVPKYSLLHEDALQAVGDFARLKIERLGAPQRAPKDVKAFYNSLPVGRYLFIGDDHAVALVKSKKGLELFDSNSGYANFDSATKRKKGLQSLFEAYCQGSNSTYSLYQAKRIS